MCGLWGAAALNKLYAIDVSRLSDLCVLSWTRGTDSTGMMDVLEGDKKEKVRIFKTVKHPYDFARENIPDVVNKRWKDRSPLIIAGHNRYATVGKITQKNCHPFTTDKIAGMHNGTITCDFTGKDKFETDSEGFINLISQKGIEAAIGELDSFRAAYALVWWDSAKKKLFVLRNRDRTLWHVKYGGALFWASERRILTFMMEHHKAPSVEPQPFKEDMLYSLGLNQNVTEFVEEKEIKATYKYNPKRVVEPLTREHWWDAYGEYSDVDWSEKLIRPDVAIRNTERDISDLEASLQRTMQHGNVSESGFYDQYDDVSGLWCTKHQIQRMNNIRVNLIEKKAILKDLKAKHEDKSKTALLPILPQKKEGGVDFRFPFGTKGDLCTELAYQEKIKCGCHGCSDVPDIKDDLYWFTQKDFLCVDCQNEAATSKHSFVNYYANFDMQKLLDHVEARWAKEFRDKADNLNISDKRTIN